MRVKKSYCIEGCKISDIIFLIESKLAFVIITYKRVVGEVVGEVLVGEVLVGAVLVAGEVGENFHSFQLKQQYTRLSIPSYLLTLIF